MLRASHFFNIGKGVRITPRICGSACCQFHSDTSYIILIDYSVIFACTTIERVIACATSQPVLGCATIDGVIACETD